jgi:hypothetical protein
VNISDFKETSKKVVVTTDKTDKKIFWEKYQLPILPDIEFQIIKLE